MNTKLMNRDTCTHALSVGRVASYDARDKGERNEL